MTNFRDAKTVGDIIGVHLLLALVLYMFILCGLLAHRGYIIYQDARTIKIVKQGDEIYTGFVSTHNGSVTVISGQRKTILNSVNGKIEIEQKD